MRIAGAVEWGIAVVDRLRGRDYRSVPSPEALGFASGDVHRATPSNSWMLYRALRTLGDVRGASILDVGCGRGSAMRVMRALPFERVDGLEISDENATIAQSYLGERAARRSSVFTADATTFDRYGDYDVLFFYNPFPESVMTSVAAQIARCRTDGAPLTVVYNTPRCEAELLRALPLQHSSTLPSDGTNEIRIYTTN
ncbi:MAG: class I SAM-dependent methyltransferase [Actinomycetes bacterium]